ncbi:MAG: TonB-dependent receptor [Muribaculaceae bacterium]|nr:TonB-dependent receptor [Muribaculaceae bacterium]
MKLPPPISNGTLRSIAMIAVIGSAGLMPAVATESPVMAAAAAVSAAPTRVTGQVTDKAGEPIIGATVMVKGTNTGTVTDIDGRFSLEAPAGATINISYIGYKSMSIAAGQNMDVVLQEDNQVLDEVVVVGYGSQLKRTVTGAITTVKGADIEAPNAVSVDNLLQGKVAGMVITQNSAQPGSGMTVNIRGQLSPRGSNAPLYVIDGVVINSNSNSAEKLSPNQFSTGDGADRSPLATLNPNDIQSIDVMKDASAAAIYGASAANGVIIITTKKGRTGKPRVSYSGSYSIQGKKKYYDLLDGQAYMQYVNNSRRENFLYRGNYYPYGPNPAPTSGWAEAFTAEEIANAKTYDHVGEITRTGHIHDHNVSISAGSENFRLYSSFNYYDHKSILKVSDLQRFSGRINFDADFSRYVKLSINSMYTYMTANNPSSGSGRYNQNEARQTNAAIYFPSCMPLYDEEGNLTTSLSPLTPNPAAWFHIKDQTTTKRLMFTPKLEVNLTHGFKAYAQASVDQTSENREIFSSSKAVLPSINEKNYGGFSDAFNTNYGFEEYVSYDNTFGTDHSLNAVIGTGYYIAEKRSHGVLAYNFPTDIYENNNIGSTPDLERSKLSSHKTRYNKLSYFARVNYSFKNRYIFGATLRRDGSSAFAKNNKWGWFPGVSGAWVLSEENFLRNVDKIDFLKLRAGYGTSGNESILTGGTYSLTTYGNASGWGDYYYFGGIYHKGIIQKEQGNPNLKWETDVTVNVGLDYGFFNNRLSGAIEYYVRTAKDLLDFTALPVTGLVSNIAKNVGSTRSRGIEFSVRGTIIENKDWALTAYGNIAHNKSYWVERNPEVAINPWLKEKDDLNPIYGWRTNGIFRSQEEIDSYTSNGKVLQPDAKPGNIRYVDVNGDGELNEDDIVRLGTYDPKLHFGFGLNLRYKRVHLDIDTYGSLGGKAYDAWYYRGMTDDNTSVHVNDRWTSYNPDGWYPGIAADVTAGKNKSGTNDFTLKTVNFWRFKNIKVTYMLPENFLRKLKVASDASVFADLQNTLCLHNYQGLDPEMEHNYGAIPMPFTVVMGLNINF